MDQQQPASDANRVTQPETDSADPSAQASGDITTTALPSNTHWVVVLLALAVLYWVIDHYYFSSDQWKLGHNRQRMVAGLQLFHYPIGMERTKLIELLGQ